MSPSSSLVALACAAIIAVATPAEARRKPPKAIEPATLNIVIHTGSQSMSVSSGGSHIAQYKVSTGKPGYRTPKGSWRVQRMARVHWSRLYKAPLPHAIFFVGGVAIHATKGVQKLGTAASHGCVRLSPDDAARLYAMVARNGMKKTLVTVTN